MQQVFFSFDSIIKSTLFIRKENLSTQKNLAGTARLSLEFTKVTYGRDGSRERVCLPDEDVPDDQCILPVSGGIHDG